MLRYRQARRAIALKITRAAVAVTQNTSINPTSTASASAAQMTTRTADVQSAAIRARSTTSSAVVWLMSLRSRSYRPALLMATSQTGIMQRKTTASVVRSPAGGPTIAIARPNATAIAMLSDAARIAGSACAIAPKPGRPLQPHAEASRLVRRRHPRLRPEWQRRQTPASFHTFIQQDPLPLRHPRTTTPNPDVPGSSTDQNVIGSAPVGNPESLCLCVNVFTNRRKPNPTIRGSLPRRSGGFSADTRCW